jgi:two-component system response regulator AtoC
MRSPKDRYPNVERSYPAERTEAMGRGLLLEDAIASLAPSRATVLIVGGSDTEKALVARALHDRSPRVGAAFVTVDCAAVPPDRIDEGLFGGPSYCTCPSQGGATSAIREAERGTLYVANVELLPRPVQPRFLGFLDEAFTIRVVVSCSVDLEDLARRGLFREDLAERLLLVVVDLSDPR